MAKDKNETSRTPKTDASERDYRRKSDVSHERSPKPGMDSGGMKQKSDRDSEGRFTTDSDSGTPKGSRGGQSSTPDRNSQRIDDDDDDEDMDFRPSRPAGTPRSR